MPDQSGLEIPHGFRFAGVHCGIKPSAPDLALIVADAPCVAAGVYTQNLVRAACIDWNRSITPCRNLRAVVVNSGNANACTGRQGERDNASMAEMAARAIAADGSADPRAILVLSTGVIGRPMPMERLAAGISAAHERLAGTFAGFEEAAAAIMTTDHSRKTVSRVLETGAGRFRIAAMAKGAGMIGPNMATMLAVIVTDFPLSPDDADACLRHAADRSFNRISVEGHTSTNDAALLLAPPGHRPEADRAGFREALAAACLELARMIPADGEGATHLIHVVVRGAGSDSAADRVARTIALSNLVKTAVAGADPNWGRIVSAAGYAGVAFDPREVSLTLNGIRLFERGEPLPFDAVRVSAAIRASHETMIELVLGGGAGSSEHFSSDLTADYVRINADYTT